MASIDAPFTFTRCNSFLPPLVGWIKTLQLSVYREAKRKAWYCRRTEFMRLGSQRGQIVCTDVLLLVVGACCVVWGFGNSWISGFQTLIVVIVVAIIYKSCLRDICGPEMRSKGVFKLAERGDIDGIKRELGKKDISINKRDEYNCNDLLELQEL
jgi:hypothetical protein